MALLIRGDYVIGDATLNRFFALHVIAIPLVLLGLVVAHIIALHDVGSNNPDGIDIKAYVDARGKPVDGIPFHPYYTVHDLFWVSVFLIPFFGVVFFFPEFGGYFLEWNNFIPADPLQGPPHIAPLWYFTPYYSILRATTEEFMIVLAIGTIGMSALLLLTTAKSMARGAIVGGTIVVLTGYFTLDAKFWGVVLMGVSVTIIFTLPWLDHSASPCLRRERLSRRRSRTALRFVANERLHPLPRISRRLRELRLLLIEEAMRGTRIDSELVLDPGLAAGGIELVDGAAGDPLIGTAEEGEDRAGEAAHRVDRARSLRPIRGPEWPAIERDHPGVSEAAGRLEIRERPAEAESHREERSDLAALPAA